MSQAQSFSRRLAAMCLAGLFVSGAALAAPVDPAKVPEPKRSKPALYLEAVDVPAFLQANGGTSKIL
jgi:hypothetical protein